MIGSGKYLWEGEVPDKKLWGSPRVGKIRQTKNYLLFETSWLLGPFATGLAVIKSRKGGLILAPFCLTMLF